MKRTLREWFNMLKKEYRTKAFENTKRQTLLEQGQSSMWDAITGAFFWDEPPEGHDYWTNIAHNPQNYVLKKHLKDL